MTRAAAALLLAFLVAAPAVAATAYPFAQQGHGGSPPGPEAACLIVLHDSPSDVCTVRSSAWNTTRFEVRFSSGRIHAWYYDVDTQKVFFDYRGNSANRTEVVLLANGSFTAARTRLVVDFSSTETGARAFVAVGGNRSDDRADAEREAGWRMRQETGALLGMAGNPKETAMGLRRDAHATVADAQEAIGIVLEDVLP